MAGRFMRLHPDCKVILEELHAHYNRCETRSATDPSNLAVARLLVKKFVDKYGLF